jgi:Ca2+-transporting ATPase
LGQLQSIKTGLTAAEAAERLGVYGANRIEERKRVPAWKMFLLQFTDFMILVLIAAAVLSGILGDLTDAWIILVIVFLNAIVGFVQEYRAEKAIEALRKLAEVQALVLRDGKAIAVPSVQLVPGDIVMLEAGFSVPADLRLLETYSLKTDESALTGESVSSDKDAGFIAAAEASPGDRLNSAFKGTLVTHGRATGLVTATGMQTEIGRIAGMLQGADLDTPLKKRMADFGRKLSYLILLICVLLFGVGLLRGEDAMQMLLLAISLAVAAIPEAMPALITVALARGASRLVKQQVLIRKLPAVETLGSVTYICSDKTGTITRNRMELTREARRGEMPAGMPFHPWQMVAALNSDVRVDEKGELSGDPTETAILRYAMDQMGREHFLELNASFPRIGELPFDSQRKRMSTLHRIEGADWLLVKGASEAIAAKLADAEERDSLLETSEAWAKEGLRVLAFAYRKLPASGFTADTEAMESELHLAGMAALLDPPRPEVIESIRACRSAGIHPVMITGDHPETARAIARATGIAGAGDDLMTGAELLQVSDPELESRVEHISVYARVSPEQKLRIVKALQKRGHFVAMTGDGVNDAPSLKAADIGVAMGITGTDVSREAAHMILLDDHFATIVKAVREGRRIYDNIRRFVRYILTCNSAEIWTLFLAPVLGMPNPLLPVHILWINLVTDGLPGLALANEKAEANVMERPPRPPGESLFAGGNGFHILWVGLFMAALTLGTQAWSLQQEGMHWQTMVFTVLSLSQLGHVLSIRSERTFLYKQGLFSNKPLLGAVALTFVLQLGVIYLPAAQEIFHTEALTLQELLICIGVSAVLFHAVELEKWLRMRRERITTG